MTQEIHYVNNSGATLRRRGGEEIRPLAGFWTSEYEPGDGGFTVLEDNTLPVVRGSLELAVTATPQQVLIPGPRNSLFMEVTVQAVTDGGRVEVGFNRETDPTAPVDGVTRYCETVDTRKAYCLWLSGTGTARVIFKELLR
jgi:hypothetical protein